jgi:hypothetical protein
LYDTYASQSPIIGQYANRKISPLTNITPYNESDIITETDPGGSRYERWILRDKHKYSESDSDTYSSLSPLIAKL